MCEEHESEQDLCMEASWENTCNQTKPSSVENSPERWGVLLGVLSKEILIYLSTEVKTTERQAELEN